MKGVPLWVARIILVLVALLGIGVAIYRYRHGLGAATNLGDNWPWGLWIAFDLLCGVALAAGGFTIAATVYILGREKYRPVARAAILTAFLGYVLVIVALLVDLGQPHRIIHMIWMWNPHSVLFEVGWCVLLYTTVLALEFAPVVLEKWKMDRLVAILRTIQIPLVIAGIGLSTLHQSSLGSLFLAAGHRLHPLWFSPILPVHFFLSAVSVGLAMVIFESTLSSKIFGRSIEKEALEGLARALPWALGIYLLAKLIDLVGAGELNLAFQGTTQANMFLVEILGGVILPILLLAAPSVRRSTGLRFLAALLVVGGLIVNRFNVALVGMTDPAGTTYFPRWTEFAITAGIIAIGLLVFGFAVRHFKVFPEEHDAGGGAKSAAAA